MKRVLVCAGAATALVSVASAVASPSALSQRGVVVARQHGVLLVASSRGLVRTVSGQAAVGSRVLVRGGRIVERFGRVERARVRGVVVRRSGKLTFLSVGRHLLVVHAAGRRLASATDTAPAPGTVVQQTVSFDSQGNLDDQGEQQVGQSSQTQVQATVQAVGNGTVTLVITDANNQQQTLTIPLPAGLTLPSSLIGTQVTLDLSFANGQATANEPGDANQQGNNEQGNSQTGQSADAQQGNNEDTQQASQTSTTSDQQTSSTTDQQTTSGSHDGGSSGGSGSGD